MSKKQGLTLYCDFNDTSAIIQSTRARSATAQAVILNAIVQQLAVYTQHDLIPVSKLFRVPSLLRLGYSQMLGKTGYKPRPEMWNNALTLQVLEEFFQRGGNPGHDSIVVSQEHLAKADMVDEIGDESPLIIFHIITLYRTLFDISGSFALPTLQGMGIMAICHAGSTD